MLYHSTQDQCLRAANLFYSPAANSVMKIFMTCLLFLIYSSPVLPSASAQEPALVEALRLSSAGNQSAALAIFDDLLKKNPDHLLARLGRAYARSWQGRQKEAQEDFAVVLQKSPSHAEAQIGMAYSLAWSGKGRAAREAFSRAEKISPRQIDPAKARRMLRELPAFFEVSLWGGATAIAGEDGLGIRLAELALWPAQNFRVWAKYDNALSLDNSVLLREGKDVAAISLGSLVNWKKHYTTRVEVGRRELPNDIAQTLVQLEQVFYFRGGAALKIGGFTGPREDDRGERLFYTGFNFPLTPKFRVEPVYFYAKTTGVENKENRFLLAGEYQFTNGWRLNAGAAFGKSNTELPSTTGNLWAGHLMLTAPLGAWHWAYFLFRHEDLAADNISVISGGIRFRVER